MANVVGKPGDRYGRLVLVKRIPVPEGKSDFGASWWLCRCDCGKEWPVPRTNLRSGATKGCGCRLTRGVPDRKVTEAGYVRIYVPEHPRANGAGRVLEHLVVMEALLGRPLVAGENVHHVNGVKDDNRPENLELWVKPQPTGVRAEDALSHALDIVRRYAPHLLVEGASE